MINPQMPNMPGAGVVTDTLDFVKNLWGSMGVPGAAAMATPTLSVDDLDKKITDLKAVEAWLNVNTAMVRGTIQALEVQRGTIATIKAMSEAMAQAMAQPGGADKAPFGPGLFGQGKPASDTGGSRQGAGGDAGAEANGSTAGHGAAAGAEAGGGTAGDSAAAGAQPGAAFTSAAVWWNLLQDQFKQAVNTAMSPDAASKFTQAATDAANASSELSKSMAQTMSGAAMKAAAPEESASKKPSGKQAAKPRNGTSKPQDE